MNYQINLNTFQHIFQDCHLQIMDGLIQTNKEMKYTLKKALVVNAHKTLQPGAVMDVTQEYAKWLEKAQKSGDLISDEEDKKYFISDLESAPWFGCN